MKRQGGETYPTSTTEDDVGTMASEQAVDSSKTPTNTASFAIGTASPKPRRVIRARRPPRTARTPPTPIFQTPHSGTTETSSTAPKKRSAGNDDGENGGGEPMMPPLASRGDSSQTDDQSSVDTASENDADDTTVNDPHVPPSSSTEVDEDETQFMEDIFNVVSPLSVQNRFQSFQDDDDDYE
eukprot:scaffold45643_cov92-Cyclotella_meneghiniana.AAC.6